MHISIIKDKVYLSKSKRMSLFRVSVGTMKATVHDLLPDTRNTEAVLT